MKPLWEGSRAKQTSNPEINIPSGRTHQWQTECVALFAQHPVPSGNRTHRFLGTYPLCFIVHVLWVGWFWPRHLWWACRPGLNQRMVSVLSCTDWVWVGHVGQGGWMWLSFMRCLFELHGKQLVYLSMPRMVTLELLCSGTACLRWKREDQSQEAERDQVPRTLQ